MDWQGYCVRPHQPGFYISAPPQKMLRNSSQPYQPVAKKNSCEIESLVSICPGPDGEVPAERTSLETAASWIQEEAVIWDLLVM